MHKDTKFAYIYSIIQFSTFLALLFSIYMGLQSYFYVFLIVWSISPGYLLMPFFKELYSTDKGTKLSWAPFLPHLGSSWIIAISTVGHRAVQWTTM